MKKFRKVMNAILYISQVKLLNQNFEGGIYTFTKMGDRIATSGGNDTNLSDLLTKSHCSRNTSFERGIHTVVNLRPYVNAC